MKQAQKGKKGFQRSSFSLRPKDGFDWSHVTWSKPDSRIAPLCSYCSAGIGEDEVPLMVWKPDGSCAQFCDKCCRQWWGMVPL